jgi:hypothetical protein
MLPPKMSDSPVIAALVARLGGLPDMLQAGMRHFDGIVDRGYMPERDWGWWARQDSNLRQHRYERSAKDWTAAEILAFSMNLTESSCE